MELYRQGDVLIRRISKIPEGAELVRRDRQAIKGKGIILAAGEATGHHHAIKDRGASLRRLGNRRFVKVHKCGAKVTHEEHDPIKLPAGDYEVKRQREYAPPASAHSAPRSHYVYD